MLLLYPKLWKCLTDYRSLVVCTCVYYAVFSTEFILRISIIIFILIRTSVASLSTTGQSLLESLQSWQLFHAENIKDLVSGVLVSA